MADVVAALLFMTTLLRMCLVVGANPIVAYGNSYDFVRQSACIGLWEHYRDGRDKTAANPARPVHELVFDHDTRPDVCLPSSDNLFPFLATRGLHRGTYISLQRIGWLKLFVAAAMTLAVLAQPQAAALRIAFGAGGLLAFGDVALLSYFNTLYLDGSVVIFGFVSMSLTCSAWLRTRPPDWLFCVLLCAVLAWFAFARAQYAAFAMLLMGVAAIGLLAVWNDRIAALLLGALAAATVTGRVYLDLHANSHAMAAAKANVVDTVLGAVLPASRNKQAALHILGLPEACAAAIGADWYSSGFPLQDACPAIYAVRRIRLVPLFATDPATLWQPLAKGIDASRPAYLNYLGHFERPLDQALPRFRALEAASLSTWVNSLPARAYRLAICALCAGGALAMLIFFGTIGRLPIRMPPDVLSLFLPFGLGGCLIAYAVVSSVFGDGLIEVPRHAAGLLVGLALQLGCIAALPFCRSRPALDAAENHRQPSGLRS